MKRIPWLKGLRFDIYFPRLKIAVEYDGLQHFVPIEKFGGLLGLEQTLLRDLLKNRLCDENNRILIRVRYNYTEQDYKDLILKIISYA